MLRKIAFATMLAAIAPTAAIASTNLLDTITRVETAQRPYSPVPRRPVTIFEDIKEARSGCCSHHGGVAGCDSATGHQMCGDGSDSPSCGCE